ncbi:helix-turn-helix transcriptional regulator [Leucobacter chinensis]|uniref:helix-turn-helix transcriptional regulator n=1 Tax=Leucobacter chinensis TaxID=2851010 RepID=UPI001C249779
MAEASAEQRVLSLILALLTTGDRGSTKQALLSTVYGYAESYRRGGDNASLERKFERDKDQLRDLGIPLETFTPYDSSGNNQETHYRIRKQVLQIPDTLTFSDDELRMLNAAALVWQEGSLSVESRRAIMKLGSLSGPLVNEPVTVGPVLTIAEPSVAGVREAMVAGRDIAFMYRKPGEAGKQRTVAPLRLHRADRRWHLIAYDHDRDDYRTFLLSRIVGEVTILPNSFDEALGEGASAVERELAELEASREATLVVTPGSRADHALSARAVRRDEATGSLTLNTLDYVALAEELIGYGADVSVVEPSDLIEHVQRLASAVATLHGGNAS